MLDSNVTSQLHILEQSRGVIARSDEFITEESFVNFPTLPEKALSGAVGKIVNAIEPYTEADKSGLLIHLLAGFGCLVGRSAYYQIGQTRHYLKLFCVIVGRTGQRKGTAWSEIKPLLVRADESFEKRIIGGLSSGEGLIYAVRDAITKEITRREKGSDATKELEIVDNGVEDKRLFAIEEEFASVLMRGRREGNTLSAIIRQAWDDESLRVITKNPVEATHSHISIIGHITPEELRKQLNDTETANGFANRFLWVCVRRSKYLPNGDQVPEKIINSIVGYLANCLNYARMTTQMVRDMTASEMWCAKYKELSDGASGLLGAVTSRATAQVVRLSCLYAILDQSEVITADHLESALALWQYCEESAKYIFDISTGDKNADKIITALTENKDGMTYTHADLVVMARKWLQPKSSVVVSEICAMGAEQPDAIGWDGATTRLVECKASRSDFLSDKKKLFRQYLEQGLGDFRYYLAPAGVIKETDVLPTGFGWLEVNPMTGKIRTRIKALRQPKKSTDRETYILLSLLRRIGQQTPSGCSIKCYSYETQNRTVLEVEQELSENGECREAEIILKEKV